MQIPFKLQCNNATEQWRRDTFWEKEPETIEWIKGFKNFFNRNKSATFIDIGANIGLYSLYAAYLYPDMTIFAIEPDMLNYISLLQNIHSNDFKNIIPLHVAMDSWFGVKSFMPPVDNDDNKIYQAGMSGGKLINRVESSGRENNTLADGNPAARENSLASENFTFPNNFKKIFALTLDSLYYFCNTVDFVKIDVDGNEYDILFGMRKTCAYVKSILVEMDTREQRHVSAVRFLEKEGFLQDEKLSLLPNHSSIRRREEGNGHIINYIFNNKKLFKRE